MTFMLIQRPSVTGFNQKYRLRRCIQFKEWLHAGVRSPLSWEQLNWNILHDRPHLNSKNSRIGSTYIISDNQKGRRFWSCFFQLAPRSNLLDMPVHCVFMNANHYVPSMNEGGGLVINQMGKGRKE